jgi:hypothetical protein
MDTSVWGPDTDGISRVSAQEDTVVHRVYMPVKIEETIYDDVQRHSGGFSSTTDNGQCGALSFEECFDEDSTVDISIESHEVALQQDSVQELQHLAGQLRVREDMIMAAIRHIDDTHAMVAEYCWKATMARDSSDGEFSIEDFQTLRERVTMMRTDYQQLLMDRDYLLEVGERYHGALKEKETEVDRLTHELVSTQVFLEGTQTTLQESESRVEKILEESSRISTTSISVESQSYASSMSLEDVSDMESLMEESEGCSGLEMIMERHEPEAIEGVHVSQDNPFLESPEAVEHTHADSRAKDSSDEDTSIWGPALDDTSDEDTSIQGLEAVDTHGLSDTVIQSGYRETTGVTGYTGVSSSVGDAGESMVDHQCEETLLDAYDGMGIAWILSNSLNSPPKYMDDFLVIPLGLTNACDTFQSGIPSWRFMLPSIEALIRCHRTQEDCVRHLGEPWAIIDMTKILQSEQHAG